MKIKDEVKGVIPDPYVNFEALYSRGLPRHPEDMDDFDEERERLIGIIFDENAVALKNWETQGPINYKALREKQKDGQGSGTNFIGERISYLRERNGMEPVDVYRIASINKSTLFRIEKGENVPTEKVIVSILHALSISLADFSCFPDDFDKWKDSLYSSETSHNIYQFRDDILKKLATGDFCYTVSGKQERLPLNHFRIIRSLIESSFAILDLLPHDKDQ